MNAGTGRELWKVLHAYAESYPENPNDEDKQLAVHWLEQWQKLVEKHSNRSCGFCISKWHKLTARCPVDLSSKKAFYEWTVSAHDWVNRDLGKPLFLPEISLKSSMFGPIYWNG